MAFNPVDWFEIPTQNIARSRAFYEAVLGVALTRADTSAFAPDTAVWMFPMDENLPGCAGELVQGPENSVDPGGTRVYFACDDCDEYAKMLAFGAELDARGQLFASESSTLLAYLVKSEITDGR